MKVVVDTNGFLAAIPSKGRNKWLYHAFVSEKFIWVLSNEIIEEYTEQVGEKFSSITADFVMSSLLTSANHLRYEPSYKWQLVEQDPDDNKFVDCAIGVNADYLVSDDRHIRNLLKVKDLFPPVPIVSFKEFKRILKLL
ncbi:MAG TPA: putative toxin-antitoxin system toxin component, PIN family [Runella sp.]|nr:putative toxin-antitoxin system toxin component, PIN family [Runella sp.]HAO51735.1 putative toxin-antitoxin system toxin component, PIN family [Runella sp.]